MLEKESDQNEVPPVSILNFKHVDTNVSGDESQLVGEKNDCVGSFSLATGADQLFLNENDKPVEEDQRWKIPVDYQLLPEEFFKLEGIPPPLVSIRWLKSLNDSDDSGEDIPLSKLKNKLQQKKKTVLRTLKPTQDNELKELNSIKKTSKKKKIKNKVEVNEFCPVNRKRGRPKKCEKEQATNTEDDYSIELDEVLDDNNDEFFWNEQSTSSDLVIPAKEEDQVENDKERDNTLDFSHSEHDYFKAPDVGSNEAKEENKDINKKKKKEKTVIQGIKLGDSKMSFPCIECGKSFSAASTLKSHLRIHNGTLLICTECHRGFTTKYLLKCHMRIHNGDLFMCHKCGKGFTTAELLKVHTRGHTGDRPFFCNICKRSFPSASNLSQHKQTHNSEKKFLCFQCGSSFSQKRCLDGHMLTHAEKNHICNVCGKLWARKSDLSEHMRVHTGVKPYCCNLCPQKFTQASSLKRHKIVHMDIKPIQCMTCSKMFKCQEYYKRHLRKHEKEADYLFNNVTDK